MAIFEGFCLSLEQMPAIEDRDRAAYDHLDHTLPKNQVLVDLSFTEGLARLCKV
jgi:hypothetical protein